MSYLETLLGCQKAYDSENYPQYFSQLSEVLKALYLQNCAYFFEEAIYATQRLRNADVPKAVTIVYLTNYVMSNYAGAYLLNNQYYLRFIQISAQFVDLFPMCIETLNIMLQFHYLSYKHKDLYAFLQKTLVPAQMSFTCAKLCDRCGQMSYLRHRCDCTHAVAGKEYFRKNWKTEEQWRKANEGFYQD